MMSPERVAARRGLTIHLQVFGLVLLVALVAVPLFGALARSVDAGLRCAGHGYSAHTATLLCSR